MKLPYLRHSKWPVSREPEERIVNPSPDAQLQDHMVDELLIALEHKDHTRVRDVLMSLIQCIRDEEHNAAYAG